MTSTLHLTPTQRVIAHALLDADGPVTRDAWAHIPARSARHAIAALETAGLVVRSTIDVPAHLGQVRPVWTLHPDHRKKVEAALTP